MGNTFGHTRGEVLDAVAGDVTHGSTRAIHRGLPARRVRRRGLGATLRHQSEDRLQVDRPLRRRGTGRAGRSVTAPRVVSARNAPIGHRGLAGGPPPPSDVGRQEAPEDRGEAALDVDPPGPEYGLWSAGSRRPHRGGAAASGAGAPRAAADPDDGPQWDLDRGLQRAVQDPQRRVLLSVDGRRWLQSVLADLLRPALDRDRHGPADLPRSEEHTSEL